MRLVCSPEHPLANQRETALSQINGIEMIGFDRELTLRKEIDQCLSKAGVHVKVQLELDNADSMIRAIQANHGIGIIPEAAVRRETAVGSLRVVACRELRMTRPLGIIFRRSGRLHQAGKRIRFAAAGSTTDIGKTKSIQQREADCGSSGDGKPEQRFSRYIR